jgi:tripeptide aminopeptidase
MNLKEYIPWFEKKLLSRFVRYVKIETTSDKHAETVPSSKGQLYFARALVRELHKLGLTNAKLDGNGFVYAMLPASSSSAKKKTISFMAHLDTSPDVTAHNVLPLVHKNYNGKAIVLKNGVRISPHESPYLRAYKNKTIITSDGTTLLGADDKAGVAEIITAVEFLLLHPEIEHPTIEVIFSPDEEIGRGMDKFPMDKSKAEVCFTVDGSEEGAIEVECFEAYKLFITFTGRSIHLGEARGKLINAVELAARMISMLPENESPQATDGRFGYYCCIECTATIEKAKLEVLIRDFTPKACKRRIGVVRSIVKTIEKMYPGARGSVQVKKQYSNMWASLKAFPKLITVLEQAVLNTGITPIRKYIRGGTDGARLSAMGIPAPNIFTGGHNFHSYKEWTALPAMVRAVHTIVNISELWISYHEAQEEKKGRT